MQTKYSIGDKVTLDGVTYSVVSIHLYIAKDFVTERYYLGSGIWITLDK